MNAEPAQSDADEARRRLLEREARFWDAQEEAIDSLYARPHDWRFAPELADAIIAPKVAHLRRVVARHRGEVSSLLDVGCGNGWFCHAAAELGIRAVGVDVAPRKVETARRVADERGLAALTRFEAVDVLDLSLDEPVDLLTAHGSLHHFPDLEQALPRMVERLLRPGGLMLFVEPHHEGMPPALGRMLLRLARGRLTRRLFDLDFYLEVTGKAAVDAPDPETPDPSNVRVESPAGRAFLGSEPDMGAILRARYEVLDERLFLGLVGHLTNAFHVYSRSKALRGAWRLALPVLSRVDALLCRAPRYGRWAEEGVWLLRKGSG